MAGVSWRSVTKRFEDGAIGLDGFSLEVREGELFVLVGPSGSGKSTALRILAGLESASAGEVCIGDASVQEVPPEDRDVAMVFQGLALYPHMTVERNLEFPLAMRGVPRAERREKARETARILGLDGVLARRPSALSGGQKQRVAIGRAIVRDPAVFLMDEPLSSLDARLRVELRGEIAELQRRLGTTTVYVTHDQVEAMTLGDRIAVLDEGRLLQAGTPDELYADPDSAFVASFIGSPGMNLLDARVDVEGGRAVLEIGSETCRMDARDTVLADFARARDVRLGVRPEACRILRSPGDVGEGLRAQISNVEELGHERLVHAVIAGTEQGVVVRAARDAEGEMGDGVALGFEARDVYVFSRDDGARIRSRDVRETQ